MPKARDTADAIRALSDAMRDCTYAQAFAVSKDFYGKSHEVRGKLERAWIEIYDARKILEGGHTDV